MQPGDCKRRCILLSGNPNQGLSSTRSPTESRKKRPPNQQLLGQPKPFIMHPMIPMTQEGEA